MSETPAPVASLAGLANTDPLTYFQQLHEVYRQAEQSAGLQQFTYEIGGEVVQLRFAGSALPPSIARAFAHRLSESSHAPAMTVHLWDSESTGARMLPPAWAQEDFREHGKVRGFFDGRFYTMFQWGSQALSMLDVESGQALFWLRSSEQMPYFERAAPLRTILHLWFRTRGLQLVHAAAVGFPDGGMLLVGKAGSGKSNSTLACLSSDLYFLADDYSLLRANDAPMAYSIYNTAKTFGESQTRLPFLNTLESNPDRPEYEKALYFVHEHFPEKILPGFPLRGIVIPRVTGQRDSALRPVSPAAALAAIAPSTILQLPGAGEAALQAMANVVRRVPCYILEAGTDLAQVPSLIAQQLRAAESHV